MGQMKYKFGLGTFRLFLALCVAFSHLWDDMLPGPAAYAVWGFFVLSGFLMTLILTKKYGTDKQGIKNYAFNRFLRIYPSYFIVSFAGAIVLMVYSANGMDSTVLNPAFMMPSSITQWIGNFIMNPFGTNQELVPVAHALYVEVWAYMLMPFAAKSKTAAWLGFVIVFLLNYQIGFSLDTFADRYSNFSSSILGFFVGSLCLHYFDNLKRFAMPMISVLVWCIHAMIWWYHDPWPWTYGLYTSLFFSAWVVISLFPIKVGATDKLLGDMSYLVYLIHTTVGMCVFGWFGSRSIEFCTLSVAITFAISLIMIYTIERPLQNKFKIIIKK